MIWIEMSRDETHGGGDWSFLKCVWAPLYKKSNDSGKKQLWPFWENVLKVDGDDIILHLRGKSNQAAFTGYSLADGPGHITREKPPSPGEWDYCESFYRAFLKEYSEFDNPIYLYDFFANHERELRSYYDSLTKPKNVFFTIQAGRVQCLNGAYLTMADQRLLRLIFDGSNERYSPASTTISTSEAWRQVKQRSGQTRFSDSVKANYGYKCCFPNCQIDDPNYLVGSHIARWADNPLSRGNIDNGLCLCSLHDRAFEIGDFSLDDKYRVILTNVPRRLASSYFQKNIAPYASKHISLGKIKPNIAALQEHKKRCSVE